MCSTCHNKVSDHRSCIRIRKRASDECRKGRPTKQVPKVEIENERTSNIETPSAASTRTSHATDEACTILADLEDNAPNPKRKQRRKAGKKSTQINVVWEPTGNNWGNINVCSPRQTNTWRHPCKISETFFKVSTWWQIFWRGLMTEQAHYKRSRTNCQPPSWTHHCLPTSGWWWGTVNDRTIGSSPSRWSIKLRWMPHRSPSGTSSMPTPICPHSWDEVFFGCLLKFSSDEATAIWIYITAWWMAEVTILRWIQTIKGAFIFPSKMHNPAFSMPADACPIMNLQWVFRFQYSNLFCNYSKCLPVGFDLHHCFVSIYDFIKSHISFFCTKFSFFSLFTSWIIWQLLVSFVVQSRSFLQRSKLDTSTSSAFRFLTSSFPVVSWSFSICFSMVPRMLAVIWCPTHSRLAKNTASLLVATKELYYTYIGNWVSLFC